MAKISSSLKLLGLPEKHSKDDIKLAYRRLCAIHHPDRGGDRVKFDEVNKAYRVLLKEIDKVKPCELCDGTGSTTVTKGFYSVKVRCTLCKGSGVQK